MAQAPCPMKVSVLAVLHCEMKSLHCYTDEKDDFSQFRTKPMAQAQSLSEKKKKKFF